MRTAKFNLSNYKLLSCDMGELVPVGLHFVNPGDHFKHSTSAFIRVSPLLAPVMHPVHVKVHHWFVPLRLVWEDFQEFITGGEDGMNASVLPKITTPASTGFAVGSLADYLGVKPGVPDFPVSALPFRAYGLIFNEFYRDQDLETKLTISKASGADTTTSTTLQNVAWEKDYFTTARPWTQKGPEITIPLGTSAPVVSTGEPIEIKGSIDGTNRNIQGQTDGDLVYTGSVYGAQQDIEFGDDTGLETDLSEAEAPSVIEFREALALQRYQENRARYGGRYPEYLRFLGVNYSDKTLQRPQYLGGGRQVIQFSEVLQQAEGTNPVGTLRGHGASAIKSNRYRRYFEEHGYVITLLSVKPKTMYADGLPRHWSYATKEDFFQRELQHIGQQAIKNKEVYMAHSSPDGDFGFQDRYDELRRQESTIAGEFRTSDLNFWHMARIFASNPTLNADFIKAVPTKRVNAIQNKDVLWIMAQHHLKARRGIDPSAKSFIY